MWNGHGFDFSFVGDGVLVCSIDNMPTQLPREATDFFGDLLYPHLESIILSKAKEPFEQGQFSDVVKSVSITNHNSKTRFGFIP